MSIVADISPQFEIGNKVRLKNTSEVGTVIRIAEEKYEAKRFSLSFPLSLKQYVVLFDNLGEFSCYENQLTVELIY